MIKSVLLRAIVLAFVFISFSNAYSASSGEDNSGNTAAEKIWALEDMYFANLYKANYERVLAIVNSQFLGWPGSLPQPIDREESERFMKKLVPSPASCSFKIERAGIRLLKDVALTQYTIHVSCSDTAVVAKTQSSRITHTWVKDGGCWKLLGGMSYDK